MMKTYLLGPFSRFGLIVAALTCAIDQASKLWVLYSFDLINRRSVPITPFLDFTLVWNRGISYGWLQQETALGQWLLLAFKAVVVAAIWVWLARSTTRLTALALGLIIGGAVGNAIDRVFQGAVVDFLLFHLDTAGGRFNWYVFNLADVAVVAGVIGLLYESFIGERAVKAP